MERRKFLKKSAVAAGIVSIPGTLLPLAACTDSSHNSSRISGSSGIGYKEIRSRDYLKKVRSEKNLPKPVKSKGFNPTSSGLQITPMPLKERVRSKILPKRGFCSLAPGGDPLISGNGAVNIEVAGNPYTEQIPFSHESLFMPRKKSSETSRIAHVFPKVREMILDGKYHEAVMLAYNEWQKNSVTRGIGGFGGGRFSMLLELPKSESVKNYLRTVNFESAEVKVHWTDERGDWVRRIFSSRPDNVVVQWLTAPEGQSMNVRIRMSEAAAGRGMRGGQDSAGIRSRAVVQGNSSQSGLSRSDFNEQRLIIKGHLDPSVDNRGFVNITRVVRNGGSARLDGETLVIENALSVMLLTRIEYLPDYSEEKVEAVLQSLEGLDPDYPVLLEKAGKVQSEMLNRITVDFGGPDRYGFSSEELLSDQRSCTGYSGAFLKTFFEMCRYWFIVTTGKYRSVSALTNVNTNLQIAPISLGNYIEGEMAYFDWVESLIPDYHNNARNIYGMRGAHYPIAPSKDSGVFNMFDYADNTGETWPHPFWISAGGWVVRPFWDHYLVTGDLDFLRNRMVPLYKDLALFYEDFLTITDKDGHYIFVPSFSPENNPGNLDPGCMAVINATMDISVCREVLANLVESCELLGIEAGNIPKWKAMLEKLPPYLTNPDGTLKEWAWPDLEDRYNHRHISQCYGAWPGDEIDPDRTPLLAKAAVLADRKRVPERLAAHSHCQRGLVGARLKDVFVVDTQLRQLLEQGFVGTTFICPHDPYTTMRIADAQGGIPAIMMEMLAYSRPGVIEVLPALPPALTKGSINGMLLRSCAKLDKLSWDMVDRTVDLTITSMKKQDVNLIARYGIEEISATSGALDTKPVQGEAVCKLHLPEGKPVEIHLNIGQRNPLDWINWI
ncbi:MAG: glycoside hydrolase N-terminal domain-containing protein [Bacteroidales bacterium]|nr:glycoside hydrolase N-terminal domain-containing protein [Bacteroidales bacterium]